MKVLQSWTLVLLTINTTMGCIVHRKEFAVSVVRSNTPTQSEHSKLSPNTYQLCPCGDFGYLQPGVDSEEGQRPWVFVLTSRSIPSRTCNGVLISRKHLLTTKVCLTLIGASVQVTNLGYSGPAELVANNSRVALFGLLDASSLNVNTFLPICLPNSNQEVFGRTCGTSTSGYKCAKLLTNRAVRTTLRDGPTTCFTDQYGPSRFQACNNFCIQDQSPPESESCQDIKTNVGGKMFGRTHVISMNGEICYRFSSNYTHGIPKVGFKRPTEFGWCHVNETSWGFCEQPCSQNLGLFHFEEPVDTFESGGYCEAREGQACFAKLIQSPTVTKPVQDDPFFPEVIPTPDQVISGELFGLQGHGIQHFYNNVCPNDEGSPIWRLLNFQTGHALSTKAVLIGLVTQNRDVTCNEPHAATSHSVMVEVISQLAFIETYIMREPCSEKENLKIGRDLKRNRYTVLERVQVPKNGSLALLVQARDPWRTSPLCEFEDPTGVVYQVLKSSFGKHRGTVSVSEGMKVPGMNNSHVSYFGYDSQHDCGIEITNVLSRAFLGNWTVRVGVKTALEQNTRTIQVEWGPT